MSPESSLPDGSKPDPVFLHSLREAWIVLAVWVICLVWTVGYCWFVGYGDPEEVTLLLGMPDWIVIGVGLPWGMSTAFTLVFSIWFIADDELEESGSGGKGPSDA